MKRKHISTSRRPFKTRRVVAAAAALTLVTHDFAWAVCTDGSNLPSGGYVVGAPPVQHAANWSPNTFTGTSGSVWVPDTSVTEHNDPTQPLTGGGHNWVFDQGSTLCKVTDVGPAGKLAEAWQIPPNNPTDCVILPVLVNGRVTNLGDIPYQGDVITPTCDRSLLSQPGAPNPGNTYFNQLGCSLSRGVATTPATATSFLFVAGIKGGLFSIPLDNVTPVVGGTSGKSVGPQNYYAQIPEGTKLTNAAVSKDGQFAMATSIRRDLRVWACLNPLGDPGDPSLPINPNFFSPPASTVNCMMVGSNNLAVALTNAFGPDNQPYFGGRRIVNSFNSVPGGNFTSSWPNCIWQPTGAASLADAFANNLTNGCGDAQPNFGFTSALITQPPAMITHGNYMYVGPLGGTIVQFAVTVDPISGFSKYHFRTYVTGLSLLTGLGVAEDLKSLMIFTDPTAVGLAAQEVVTRLPLCEDMLGEASIASNGGGTTNSGGSGSIGPFIVTDPGPTTTAGGGTGGGTTPPTTVAGGGGTTTPTTTGTTSTASGTTTGVGGFVGGVGAPAAQTSTASAGAAGAAGASVPQAFGGSTTPFTAAAAGTKAGGGSGSGGGGNGNGGNSNTAIPPGIALPTGSTGLFAASGRDPTGPMIAKVTFISQIGLPRIALDASTFQTLQTFANNGPGGFGGKGNPGSLANSDRDGSQGTVGRGGMKNQALSFAGSGRN